MINQAKLVIPYPIRVGFISINKKRTINFSFDNLSLFLFRERHELKTADDFEKWKEDKGSFDYLVHAAYSAAESYCFHNRIKFDLDLNKFALGFAQTDKEDLKEFTKAWKNSNEYGIAELPGKKKVTGNRSAMPNNTPMQSVNAE